MLGEDALVLTAIEKPILLLVEGRDDRMLFSGLLQHLGRTQEVAVEEYGGKAGLRGYLDPLRIRGGFESLQALVVVRDADNDCKTALQSVRDALDQYGFGRPVEPLAFTAASPRVAAIIIPCGEKTGSLENMCLQAVMDDPAMQCVRRYGECLDAAAAGGQLNLCPNRAKILANAFLASRRDPSLKIGEAARADVWNWDHEAWKPLIDFIKSM